MGMTLLDVLKLIEHEYFPPVMELRKGRLEGIDSRPQSVFNVTICFMGEEETWLTCNIQNEILVPWYDCEVSSIQPDDVNKNSICVWLKDREYLNDNFKHCLEFEEIEPKADKGEQ